MGPGEGGGACWELDGAAVSTRDRGGQRGWIGRLSLPCRWGGTGLGVAGGSVAGDSVLGSPTGPEPRTWGMCRFTAGAVALERGQNPSSDRGHSSPTGWARLGRRCGHEPRGRGSEGSGAPKGVTEAAASLGGHWGQLLKFKKCVSWGPAARGPAQRSTSVFAEEGGCGRNGSEQRLPRRPPRATLMPTAAPSAMVGTWRPCTGDGVTRGEAGHCVTHTLGGKPHFPAFSGGRSRVCRNPEGLAADVGAVHPARVPTPRVPQGWEGRPRFLCWDARTPPGGAARGSPANACHPAQALAWT